MLFRSIVGGACDGQLADIASGEFQGMHDVAICGEGQPTLGESEGCGVMQGLGRIPVKLSQFPIDQLPHQGSTAPMAQANALHRSWLLPFSHRR